MAPQVMEDWLAAELGLEAETDDDEELELELEEDEDEDEDELDGEEGRATGIEGVAGSWQTPLV